jgi:hypothetical protein
LIFHSRNIARRVEIAIGIIGIYAAFQSDRLLIDDTEEYQILAQAEGLKFSLFAGRAVMAALEYGVAF